MDEIKKTKGKQIKESSQESDEERGKQNEHSVVQTGAWPGKK